MKLVQVNILTEWIAKVSQNARRNGLLRTSMEDVLFDPEKSPGEEELVRRVILEPQSEAGRRAMRRAKFQSAKKKRHYKGLRRDGDGTPTPAHPPPPPQGAGTSLDGGTNVSGGGGGGGGGGGRLILKVG